MVLVETVRADTVSSTEFQRCVISELPSRGGSVSEPECDHEGVEVGEPGLPRDPREEERRWSADVAKPGS